MRTSTASTSCPSRGLSSGLAHLGSQLVVAVQVVRDGEIDPVGAILRRSSSSWCRASTKPGRSRSWICRWAVSLKTCDANPKSKPLQVDGSCFDVQIVAEALPGEQ